MHAPSPKGRHVRRVSIALIILLALLIGGTSAFIWHTVRRSFPTHDGEVAVVGLGDTVEVLRDAHGVPHIYAATVDDLFAAQGFVHAQDRFYEMDVRRHVTAGRLSELFGADQVDTDRFLRTLGWRRVAEQELDLLSDETMTALDAYARGVDAYAAERHPWDLGLEYALLSLQHPGYDPEPWQPADSVAWLKAMAWDLRSNVEAEIDRALIAAEVGVERTDELYPPYPYGEHPVIVDGEVVDGAWQPAATSTGSTGAAGAAATEHAPLPAAAVEALGAVRRGTESLPMLLGRDGSGLGSNSWVVAGEHTVSGAPILANDPHLGPSLPSLWYQVGLHCRPVSDACPYDVVGFSFSGVPGVVIGATHRVAWGLTNLGWDVADLYVERLDGDQYEVDGEWRPLEVHTETIDVAGGETVDHTVRRTRHGPLLSDVADSYADAGTAAPVTPDDGHGYGVALQWTALTPGRSMDAILAMNRVTDFDAFREAAARFEVPAQNLVYADVDGHIGYQAPGRIPTRPGHDGRYPAAGWTTTTDWGPQIPFEALPWTLDPEEGWIVTANNAVMPPDAGLAVASDWDAGQRARRITDLIARGAGGLTVSTMQALQLDTRHPFAPDLVAHLLALPDEDLPADVAASRRLLEGWDFLQPPESAAAALYNAVYRHLLARTFHDELPEAALPDGGARWFEVVGRLLEAPDSPWWDDTSTAAVESRGDLLQAALVDADRELRERFGDDPQGWRWGTMHTLALTHETLGTSGIGLVESRFNRGPIETGGGKSIVNAIGWTAHDGYEVDWVPSMRMVVDLGDLDQSRWVHLTGQSGHAYHPQYTDQVAPWQQGRMLAMRHSRDSVAEAATATLRLVPAQE